MKMDHPKVRLDNLLVERGLAPALERAKALVMSGNVIVDETRVDKAGALVPPDASIRIRGDNNPYVSRGGLKLRGALHAFHLDVKDLVVLDVGASTGGFTDCLLQAGAKKVYALDVGYGQLAWKLREDPRVVCIERTNIRHFDGGAITDPLDMATIDASFISLKLVIPPVLRLLKEDALILALIKPQFEVERGEVGEKGVIRDAGLHDRVLNELEIFFHDRDLDVSRTCPSPIDGPAGNKEFFILGKKRRLSPL